tara:strand:- start:582 stop:1187 length:606 start_codon:yes stop_codon:yes gene_type:complete
MRRILTLIILFASATLLSAITYKTIRAFSTPVLEITTQPLTEIKVEDSPIKVEFDSVEEDFDSRGHMGFLTAIGHQESGNNYFAVNRYGYMGKYQFGKSTLKTLKIKVSREDFLNDPELQEIAMHKLLQYNKKKLQKYIDKYEGQIVHGILVTESGLLAAAHLGGQGSVKKWFRTGNIRKDGNGVKITSYMKRFAGYKLYL